MIWRINLCKGYEEKFNLKTFPRLSFIEVPHTTQNLKFSFKNYLIN